MKKVSEVIRVKCLLLITLINLITLTTAFGQANVNSPYSRYAIGELQFPGFARNVGMGGIGMGITSPININILNPASYSSLTLTTFEGGLRGNSTVLKSDNFNEANSSTFSFDYFAFGFPIKAGKWGLAFGLTPYSNVGYNISDIETKSDPGIIAYNDQGKGGINQFFLGSGFALSKKLHFGFNASYLFGTINQVRTVVFTDNLNYFNTRNTDQTTIGDFHFTFGLQYVLDSLKISHSDSVLMIHNRILSIRKEIEVKKILLTSYEKRLSVGPATEEVKASMAAVKDSIALLSKQIDNQEALKSNLHNKKTRRDWSLNLGATLSLSSNADGTKSSLSELYIISLSGFPVVKDTAQNITAEKGVIKLPLSAGFGFTMKKGAKWLFGADVTAQDWSSYRTFGQSDSLINSLQFSAGMQYTPNERSLRSYSKIIQYRLGFHYTQTYLRLKETDLSDYGVSIGLGLPLRKTLSVIQFSFELGKMGTTVNQLVEINYFRFTLGLTFNDLWFVKPRID